MQVEDHVCLTGGEDGAVRLWDLRRVGEEDDAERDGWELGDVPEEGEFDEFGAATGGVRDGKSAEESRDGPCVRVLEGHSKAVTSMYFEDDCLVRFASRVLVSVRLCSLLGLRREGHRRVGQDAPPVGPRNGPVCDDDGHPLGDLAPGGCVEHHRRRRWRAPGLHAARRRGRRGHVCRAYATVRGRFLGDVPGLCRRRAVLGVCAGERKW